VLEHSATQMDAETLSTQLNELKDYREQLLVKL
jgi:hypothetical protein